MLNPISVSVSKDLENEVLGVIDSWRKTDMISRIWAKDPSVWTNDDESKWLGWLDIVEEELADLEKYREFHADIESAGFTDVLLMGMGGSSLCPEVLAVTFDKKNFHILDSTVPAQIKAIEEKLDLEHTLFHRRQQIGLDA
jgi:transaldolase/glucose-6-phosphate isomerase